MFVTFEGIVMLVRDSHNWNVFPWIVSMLWGKLMSLSEVQPENA